MPLLYAMIMGLGLYLWKPIKFVSSRQAKVAEGAMLLFIGPLIAKLAVSSGQSINVIIQVGPALLLQELGNLGTIFFALPIALLLGFKRETIGMTSSICREPNLGIIMDKYGFNSSETRGVLAVFVIGTMIGTIFISFLSSISASLIPYHPYAFAMASGVGSASMNAAALAPLLHMFPELAMDIEAFAGCSNLISFCFGIYICIFIGLPITEKLYKFLEPKIGRTYHKLGADDSLENSKPDEIKKDKIKNNVNEDNNLLDNKNKKDKNNDAFEESESISFKKLLSWISLLIIFSFIVSIGNWVGYDNPIFESFVGMIILSLITIVGFILERYIPYNISSIVYISLIGLILSVPGSPSSEFIIHYVSKIELVSICTVFLGYVGIAIGKDWNKFKKIGWRGVIVTVFVISGTYLCSASIAQAVLYLTGYI